MGQIFGHNHTQNPKNDDGECMDETFFEFIFEIKNLFKNFFEDIFEFSKNRFQRAYIEVQYQYQKYQFLI